MKNLILFIGYFMPPEQIVSEIKSYFGSSMKVGILFPKDTTSIKIEQCKNVVDEWYAVDEMTDEPEKTIELLVPRLFAATVRGETFIELYCRLLPVLTPSLRVPTQDSLEVCMSKQKTRNTLLDKCPEISTKFIAVNPNEPAEDVLEKVSSNLTFPVILKPTGLSTSMLVFRADQPQQLIAYTKLIQSKLAEIYEIRHGRGDQKIVIEEFIEGQLYSIDVYVDNLGNIKYCPFVKTITAAAAGKEDYYGYFQVTPSGLTDAEEREGQAVARMLVEAVGLRNSSAHIELIKSSKGWKVVEIGSRLGGYRTQMYRLGFGIPHNINDILIHSQRSSEIKLGAQVSYSAMCKIYASSEGRIRSIQGIDDVKNSEGVAFLVQNLKEEQMFVFARNGGVALFEIIITGSSEEELRDLLQNIEKKLHVEIEPKHR